MKNNLAIEVYHVKKTFGRLTALNGLSLKVKRGSITGLVGRNGAGKTTLIRTILQLLIPDEGDIFVFGEQLHGDRYDLRKKIGYVPESFSMYPYMKGIELIRFKKEITGCEIDWKKVNSLANSLSFDLNKRAKFLSKGMKQSLAFIVAVSTSPELLILDEPLAGMDPIARSEFVKILIEECAKGTTIFYSSHILTEVESIADDICIIDHGNLLVEDSLDSLKSKFKMISFLPSNNFSIEKLRAVNGITRVENSGNGFVVYTDNFSKDLFAIISQFSKDPPEVINLSLSEIFKEVVR